MKSHPLVYCVILPCVPTESERDSCLGLCHKIQRVKTELSLFTRLAREHRGPHRT